MCNLDLQGLPCGTSQSPKTTMHEDMNVKLHKNPPQALLQYCTLPVHRRLLPQAAHCQPVIHKRPTTSCTMLVVCLFLKPIECFLHLPREHC